MLGVVSSVVWLSWLMTSSMVTAAVRRSSGDGWRVGRATFYGEHNAGGDDGFSIHHGSCQFGRLDPVVGTGLNIAAIPDVHREYEKSCGKCYEIACEGMHFKDNYGGSLDRSTACLDESNSVVVTIVDVCPCNFPRNYYNNKRWCCGDMDHFDISTYAFEQLAPKNVGVIGLKYRPVPCPSYDDVRPSKPTVHVEAEYSGISGSSGSGAAGSRSSIGLAKEKASRIKDAATAAKSEEEPAKKEEPARKPAKKPAKEEVPKAKAPKKKEPEKKEPKKKPTKRTAPRSEAKPKVPSVPATDRISRRSSADSTTTSGYTYSPSTDPKGSIAIPTIRSTAPSSSTSSTSSETTSTGSTQERVEVLRERVEELRAEREASPSSPTARSTSSPSKKSPSKKRTQASSSSSSSPSRISRTSNKDETDTSGNSYTTAASSPGTIEVPRLVRSSRSSSRAPRTTGFSAGFWDVGGCSEPMKAIDIYDGGFHECFTDGGLLGTTVENVKGLDGGSAWCTRASPSQSFAAVGIGNSMFERKKTLAFSLLVEDGVPDISVALVGRKGACTAVDIKSFKSSKEKSGYKRFTMRLSDYPTPQDGEFSGCGPNTPDQIYAVSFLNNLDTLQDVCIDAMRLS